MYDYGLSILPEYGLTPKTTCRGRGALLCDTEDGWKIIRAFTGSVKRLELQYELQRRITASGELQSDCLLRSESGELATADAYGTVYTVSSWYPGRECDAGSEEDVKRAAAALARLHTLAHLPLQRDYVHESLREECVRHNAEIRRIRKYIQKKQKKNEFEKLLAASAGAFLERGEDAAARMADASCEELRERFLALGSVCHGEYTQHNILLEGRRRETVINLDKWCFDLPTADLCHFMRKVLEKHSWDTGLGNRILEAYDRVRPLSRGERQDVRLRLSYPWKYWKIANHYYGSNKVWVSAKNVEKLKSLEAQKADWLYFLDHAGI